MSVALDFSVVPGYELPEREFPGGEVPGRESPAVAPRRRPADVHILRAPAGREVAPALRLTRRGVVVLTLLVAAVGGALVWLAALSAPSGTPAPTAPAAVTVQSGDTLWSVAARFAGDRNTQSVVARIEQLNHLAGVDLEPGQVLRLR